ncbi:phosphoglycerate dehydrogenase [Zavarzinella formosa]|uniref:phosphoglycerate dehydrogenase n=1 Tax=Zavarzinella formosa TaxID=360055 RepID=UPI00037F7F6D|nr:phosphoglycerate dehydrogenase [Zavarzinella formosa]
MPKVLIAPAPLANMTGSHLDVLTAAGFELVYPSVARQMVESELLAILPGVSAAVAGSEPYSRKVFEANPQLKIVARVGVGYDAVDVQAATDHGVVVATVPGTNQDAVSEHGFMLILALAKHLMRQHPAIRDGGWPRQANVPLRGKTLGLAGLGRIGKSMTIRAEAFGMKVIAHDPFADKVFAEQHGIALVSLEDLFRESDYVSLHMPLNPGTRKIINADMLKLMKPTSFLVNTARGSIIDEPALYEVLRDKKIAGAGLDVFDEEPPLKDNPILQLDNVVMTAHTAGVDQQSIADMALLAAKCVAWISKGEWPTECVVNPEVKAKFKWSV